MPKDVQPKKRADYRIIGRRTKRIDGPDIAAGRAKYGLDTRVAGMRVATVLHPPVVGGKVVRFDAAAAKKIRGVRDVMQISTGVAIVADSTWPAFKAREVVKVEWDDGPNRDFDSRRYIDKLIAAAAQAGTAMRVDGEATKVFAAGGRELKATYVYPFYAHAPVEPMNTIASVKGATCEIWSPTQAPNRVQEFVARHLSIPKENVVVHPTLIGGGFGGDSSPTTRSKPRSCRRRSARRCRSSGPGRRTCTTARCSTPRSNRCAASSITTATSPRGRTRRSRIRR